MLSIARIGYEQSSSQSSILSLAVALFCSPSHAVKSEVTTKVWWSELGYTKTKPSVTQSLERRGDSGIWIWEATIGYLVAPAGSMCHLRTCTIYKFIICHNIIVYIYTYNILYI